MGSWHVCHFLQKLDGSTSRFTPHKQNALFLEDNCHEDHAKMRLHYMQQHWPGIRVNVRRLPSAHMVEPLLIHGEEILNSDIVLVAYRLPNTDKFRVRVTKYRWGKTDNLVFCLS